jgi:hypothetical protein
MSRTFFNLPAVYFHCNQFFSNPERQYLTFGADSLNELTNKWAEYDEIDGRLEHEETEGGGQSLHGHQRGDQERHEHTSHTPAHAKPNSQHQHHVVAAVNHYDWGQKFGASTLIEN